jgi:uncharacterized membrane protein
LTKINRSYSSIDYVRQLLNLDRLISPSPLSSKVATHSIILFSILSVPYSLLLSHSYTTSDKILLAFVTVIMILCIIFIYRQPQAPSTTFTVPAVPWLPALSVVVNVFLMTKLSFHTWVRFLIWMSMGFAIYITYGWWNSSEEYRMKGLPPPGQTISETLKLNQANKQTNNNNEQTLQDF